MKNRAWVIKLGSGGRCVPFCEKHGIVGLGWKEIPINELQTISKEELLAKVTEAYPNYQTNRKRGSATGQIYRFARECRVGDYILYYDPPAKLVVICRVTSELMGRDFDFTDQADIWLVRKVEQLITVPILDFYGGLKGRILGPRMSFWELRPFDVVDQIANGNSPGLVGASDPELEAAYSKLRDLVLHRAEALNPQDWEWLVVDYFKAQGAHIDERTVGGNQPIIDLEAHFDHGELGEEVWRVQVKRYQDGQIGWSDIEDGLTKVGEEARFCFVSAYGFAEEARAKAEEEDVRLLEARDFTQFLISGKIRESLQRKLKLPIFGTSEVT